MESFHLVEGLRKNINLRPESRHSVMMVIVF